MEKVNIHDELAHVTRHWSPRTIAELNGQHVKVVKFQGEFVWHSHADEDELFFVVRGAFRMDLPDRSISLTAGDFLVVPRATPHRPVADTEVEVMLFEPAQIERTGDVDPTTAPPV